MSTRSFTVFENGTWLHALHTENEFSVEFMDLGSQNGLGSKGTQITGAYM